MMERALKERIIGAAILVVVVILVVPVFLDGSPGENEVISTSVPLPGQSEQKVQTIVLNRDREEPVPTATGTVDVDKVQVPLPVETSAPQQVEISAPQQGVEKDDVEPAATPVAEQQPDAEPKPNPTDADEAKETVAAEVKKSIAPSTTRSSTGMWAVQLGSFSSQQNADRLASDLRKQGFAAFLSQLSTESGELHRVRIGPQKDRESAAAMAARLAKAGHKGQVVPHP